MELKIGDRVRIVSVPALAEVSDVKVRIGMTGTVKDLTESCAGVEFDDYINGHGGVCGFWEGKYGHCCCVLRKDLEKIEEAKGEVEEMDIAEETKTNTLEEKVLEVLREEIGVEIGEEFDVYQNGVKQWTCKFKGGEFCQKVNYELCKSDVWIDLIWNFSSYTFKRKPFIPEQGEDYFFLTVSRDENNNISLKRGRKTWTDDGVDYGMLALGNVFRSEEEALASKDKLLEKLEKLRKGE